jgi:hypothetical protein
MLALATLLLFVQTAGSPTACDACTADGACAPHVEIERERLPDLEARYRNLAPHENVSDLLPPDELLDGHEDGDRLREEFQAIREANEQRAADRIVVLREVAALNRMRANAPSRAVTGALADGLSDGSLAVRLEAARLLREAQHVNTARRALADSLRAVDDDYELVGRDFERRWKRLYDVDPEADDAQSLLARIWDDMARARATIRAYATLLELGDKLERIQGEMPREAKRGQRVMEKHSEELDKRRRELFELHGRIHATLDAFELEPLLVEALGAIGGEDARRALGRHFSNLQRHCPSHSTPTARALLALGVRSDVEDVVAALQPKRRPPAETLGAADVSRASYDDWRRTVHDALTECAAARALDAPSWSNDGGDAWRAWFETNAERFPESLEG